MLRNQSVVLFAVLRIHADGDRSVVDNFHLHVGAELAGAYRLAQKRGELSAESLVEGYGDIVRCGTEPRRTVTLLVRCKEGELAHYQGLTAHVEDAAVHHTTMADFTWPSTLTDARLTRCITALMFLLDNDGLAAVDVDALRCRLSVHSAAVGHVPTIGLLFAQG